MADQLALGVMTGMSGEPQAALEAAKEVGVSTVQLSYPAHLDNDEGIQKIKDAVAQTGIEITTIFCSFEGESYDSIPIVRDTVGLVPESTRAERVAKIEEISQFAQKLGVDRIAIHIGFMPEDQSDPRYIQLFDITGKILDDLKARGQVLGLETGQETAAHLARFIRDLKRDNLRVNFDPANMILYGNDDPIKALPLLAEWIDGVHCKDATWPKVEGEWGVETPLGEGDVNIPEWIKQLLATGFTGPMTIEREISGEEQKQDIIKAVALLKESIAQHRLC